MPGCGLVIELAPTVSARHSVIYLIARPHILIKPTSSTHGCSASCSFPGGLTESDRLSSSLHRLSQHTRLGQPLWHRFVLLLLLDLLVFSLSFSRQHHLVVIDHTLLRCVKHFSFAAKDFLADVFVLANSLLVKGPTTIVALDQAIWFVASSHECS